MFIKFHFVLFIDYYIIYMMDEVGNLAPSLPLIIILSPHRHKPYFIVKVADYTNKYHNKYM